MHPQKMFLLGIRQCLAHEASIALTRSEVIAFDIRRVDLSATTIGCYDASDVRRRTENNAPAHFNQASPFAPLVNLRIAELRIQDAFGFFPGSPRPAFE